MLSTASNFGVIEFHRYSLGSKFLSSQVKRLALLHAAHLPLALQHSVARIVSCSIFLLQRQNGAN